MLLETSLAFVERVSSVLNMGLDIGVWKACGDGALA